MGYPMSWGRVCSRNGLLGDYVYPMDGSREAIAGMIAGDMRRLERDSRDENHLKEWARISGATPEQCKRLLDAFFGGAWIWTMPGASDETGESRG